MRKSISAYIALAAVLACCTREDAGFEPTGSALQEEDVLPVSVLSKASSGAYTDTTYRVQLFYRGGEYDGGRMDSLLTPYAGTYCCPKDGADWLTPCAVDAAGAYDSSADPCEGAVYGLRAGAGHSYYMVVCSPAVPYAAYASVTKTDPSSQASYQFVRYGVRCSRTGGAGDHPSFSEPVSVSTSGMSVNGGYVLDLGSAGALTERRSRVAFSFRCGDAISHARLGSLSVARLRGTAVWDPMAGRYAFSGQDADYDTVQVWECPDPAGLNMVRGGSAGAWTAGESVSLTGPETAVHLEDTKGNGHFVYVLSGDYQSLDPYNMYVNDPPRMVITLVSDQGDMMRISPVPLSFVYEPQRSYYYLVTINSVFLSVTVTSRSWDPVTGLDTSIDPGETVTEYVYPFSVSVSDWLVNGRSAGSGGGNQTTDVTARGWCEGGGGSPDIGGTEGADTDTDTDITVRDWDDGGGGSADIG